MRNTKEENQKALETVISAIDTAIDDYSNWPTNTEDRRKELSELKKVIIKNWYPIICGARF